MTDSVAVFPPGYRLSDSQTGAPIIGATILFYDAGTTNPKSVFSDAALTASLGTSVTTDSLGCPTSDGTTKTDVYVNTSPYKVVVKDASGVVIETKDNRPGAVVSASSVDVSVTATFPVATKSLGYTVLAADQNTLFKVNCSSGDVTLTLPSAVDVGNGFRIGVQHAGSANQAIVVVKSGSGQTISEGTKTYGGASFALAFNGEDCEIVSDGGNWQVKSHTLPFVKIAQGIIPVVSRLATSPASPQAGDIYLLTGVGGSFSTFTTGDLAMYTGAGYVNFTPPSNCGWRAWVQGESLYYSFIASAWAVETGVAAQPGTFKAATQAVQETATANDTAVTPGTQGNHPSAPKVWGKATVSAGVPTLAASYNMTSITDTGTGQLGVTIATDFSSANWAASAAVEDDQRGVTINGQLAGSVTIFDRKMSDFSFADPTSWHWSGLGDQ